VQVLFIDVPSLDLICVVQSDDHGEAKFLLTPYSWQRSELIDFLRSVPLLKEEDYTAEQIRNIRTRVHMYVISNYIMCCDITIILCI
jgi:hypothetical protein